MCVSVYKKDFPSREVFRFERKMMSKRGEWTGSLPALLSTTPIKAGNTLLFLDSDFLDESIETGLFSGCGILFNDFFLSGFI